LPVLAVSELPPEWYVTPVGLVGSVTVFEEKPGSGQEFARVVDTIQRHVGVPVSALIGFEAAGVNALLAALAAATCGLPLVDADGMGRAFPELQQTTFVLHGQRITPVVLADDKETVLVIDGVDGPGAERLTREAVVTVGGWGFIALGALRADALARSAIRRTISRALDLGRRLRRGERAELLRAYGGRSIMAGKVVEVERTTGARFGRGSAVVEAVDGSARALRLEFQNENLLLLEDGEVRACVPDLICLLPLGGDRSMTTEQIRFGVEAEILTLPGAAQWRTRHGLGLAGPRAFGYDIEYAVPGTAGPGGRQ
jgi:hypothetical protein